MKTFVLVFAEYAADRLIRKQSTWEWVHNLIAHPLIPISGKKEWAWQFHEWTGKKAGYD